MIINVKTIVMDTKKKKLKQKSQSKKNNECSEDSNKTNTIHSQNEEIKNGNVETGKEEKDGKKKPK